MEWEGEVLERQRRVREGVEAQERGGVHTACGTSSGGLGGGYDQLRSRAFGAEREQGEARLKETERINERGR